MVVRPSRVGLEQEGAIDAVTIWAALHGYATLRASLPRFDWPAPQAASTKLINSGK
jgi:hypothetical protein